MRTARLFLCGALLCAGTLRASTGEVTPFDVAFAKGVWDFSQYDSVAAVEHFEEAVRLRPENGFAHYLLGLSHLRLGEGKEAAAEIAACLQAELPPPVEHSRILADLGAAQLLAGDAPAAIVTLEKALEDRKQDAVALHHYAAALAAVGRPADAEVARQRAQAIDPSLDPEDLPVTTPKVAGGGSGPAWNGSVSLAAEHDSNPNLLSEDLLLPVSPGGPLVSGRTADSAVLANAQVSHRPISVPGGWKLGLDLRTSGSFHQDLDYLDTARAGGGVQLVRGLGRKASLLLRAGGDDLFLDGSEYLRTADAGASILLSPTRSDTTRLDVSFHERSYADHRLADPRRTGGEIGLGLRQTRYFGRRDRYVAVGVNGSRRNADPEFEKDLLSGDIQAALPFGSRWSLFLSGWINQEDFKDSASNLFDPRGPARKDRTRGASASLSFSLTEGLRIVARGSYTRRTSSLDLGDGLPDLDYRRTVFGTSLAWSF